MLAITGTRREIASRSSSESGTLARRAIARAWTMQFVEPPIAICTIMAFSNASRVRICDGLRSSQTISTARRPECAAMRAWPASAAGIELAPGSVSPSESATAVMVEAVPIVMQWPGERAMPFSISVQSASVILPARRSSQYFQVSEPEPSDWPRQLPRSIGPAGT